MEHKQETVQEQEPVKPKKEQTVNMTLRLPKSLMDDIDRVANLNHRSRSNMIITLLIDQLENR